MKIVNVTQYEANDGRRFDTEKSCFEYEKFLELSTKLDMMKNEINEFLSNKNNYDDCIKDDIDFKDFHYCSNIWVGIQNMSLEILVNKNSSYQLDENFCIDQNKWDKFLDKYKKEYYTCVSEPTYYWGK